ncbi:DUF3892 domain-containing protein [Rubrobacter tropicus]|uniref:DUF3892 domain-containing protein n=1 Tax=Rubrobacter tropicus TaxID=2653851 RepID=UPI001A9D2E14|nr:DUF3892 domain-containing protein [Rubrobacter tropicus]
MAGKRKVVDARQDHEGNISHVRLEGNRNFTDVNKAIEIAKRGGLENAHAVKKKDGGEYLRTNPDGRSGNNLDEMAQD